MTHITLNKSDIKWHFLSWTLITAYLAFLDAVKGTLEVQIVITFIIMVNYITAYYSLSLLIIPRFWGRNPMLLVIMVIASWMLFFSIQYTNFYYIKTSLGGINPYEGKSYYRIVTSSLVLYFVIAMASFSFFFGKLSVEKIKAQTDIEKSFITKELNFLKNQFNSHITFNFLNYCYSHVYKSSKEAADSIIIFSNILRYSLQTKPEEIIPLSKEINYIENFIQLQKILSTEVYVDFNCQGEIEGKYILPCILITFIENAFKHGQVNSPLSPIEITLHSNNKNIKFNVKNLKNKTKVITNSGIGHQNVKQVLNLHYRDNYTLLIDENTEYYSCELSLNI